MKMKNLLRYARPAESWEKGMPLGNGRLGAMMLGNLAKEHIWLNEDTLWSGKPGNYNDPEVYSHLQKVRELIFTKGHWTLETRSARYWPKKMAGTIPAADSAHIRIRYSWSGWPARKDLKKGFRYHSAVSCIIGQKQEKIRYG